MNAAALMDIIGAGGVCVALAGLVNWRLGSIRPVSAILLAMALVAYLFVTLANVLEHMEVTSTMDFYEDFAEAVFFILAIFFLRQFQ